MNLPPLASTSGEQLLIVLVHGTGARNSSWIREGSALRRNLEQAFPGRIQFESFFWSGKNSFQGRFFAAQELAEKLESLEKDNPGKRIFVISHSHGGNVALKALSERGLLERVSGIVCLSTSFLAFRKRRLGAGSDRILLEITRAVPILFIYCIGFTVLLTTHKANIWLTNAVVFGALLIGGIIGAFFRRWTEKRLAILVERGSLRLPRPDQLLIIRHIGDEANGILGTATFLSWGISFFCAQLESAWKKIDDRVTRLNIQTVSSLFVVCVTFVALAFHHIATSGTTWLISFVAGGFSIFFLFVMLWELFTRGNGRTIMVAIALLLLSPILGLLGVAFGPELFVIALWIEITAEATPAGIWRILLLNNDKNLSNNMGLSHSAPYEDPQALRELTCRIKFWLNDLPGT